MVAITTTTSELPDLNYDSDAEAPTSGWGGPPTKETIQEGQVLKAGYLMKKGERLKIWKRKWFVLRTSKLAYYKDSKEYELLRIIDIRDIHRAAEVPQKHKSGVFVILTPRKTFTLQAQTIDEMHDWIEAIDQAKVHFEFSASCSDLESFAGSTVHLGEHLHDSQGQEQEHEHEHEHDHNHPSHPKQKPRQKHKQKHLFHPAISTTTKKTGLSAGIILPRRQQHKSLSLSDPDLLDKREKSRKMKGMSSSSGVGIGAISMPSTPSVATATHSDNITTTTAAATTPVMTTTTTTPTTATTVVRIPTPTSTPTTASYPPTPTTLLPLSITTSAAAPQPPPPPTTTATTTPTTTTTPLVPSTPTISRRRSSAKGNDSNVPVGGVLNESGSGDQSERPSWQMTPSPAIQIKTLLPPASPRMEHVHSGATVEAEPPFGSLSSEWSFNQYSTPVGATGVPETPSPSAPGAGGGGYNMTGANYFSSGEEEDDVDPSFLEAARLASEANAPGAGIVTDEQLGSKLVRQGYLLKLGNTYKTWRTRWFVLRGDKLTYYKNMKEYQPHGIIPLSTIIDCLQTDPVSKTKQYCLRIVTAKRSFVCCAPDEDTLLQWLDALHVECDRVAHEAHQEAIEERRDDMLQRRLSFSLFGIGAGGGSGGTEAAVTGTTPSQQQQQQQQDGGHDGDCENDDDLARSKSATTPTKPMGRTARLKMNLHSSLPHRSRSKSGDTSAAASPTNNPTTSTGFRLRKVTSLDTGGTAAAAAPSPLLPSLSSSSPVSPTTPTAGNNVTFLLAPIPAPPTPTLPVPGATVTFSA
ncbi:hypothetical protein BGZ98_007688 [Dissophora globulifera]|nr:hypothetical protein BGZ98_007688 [Dissophora globulifera]